LKYSEFVKDIIENGIVMGKPVSGFFELTSRCNLRCKMCYICGQEDHKSLMGRELSAVQWIDLGRQARDAGLLYLTLTGGEILMRKDFMEIYEALSKMGLLITLYTNATLINDDILQLLTKYPPLRVSISVYGASPDTYGKVTGHPEAYEKTIKNIRKLKAAGIILQLKTTVIKYNKDDFQQLAELARTMGLNMGIVNYISPRREGIGTDPLANRLEPMDLAKYEKDANSCMKRLYELYGKEKEDALIVDDIMSDDNLESFRKIADMSTVEKTAFRCTAGKCAFWLSWEGKLFPCGLLSEVYSEPLKKGFDEAWVDLRELCRGIPSCKECESCSSYDKCMICPARRKLETGSFEKSAPYLCDYTKARDVVLHPADILQKI